MTEEITREASPERLASQLIDNGVLTDDWLSAFRAMPRHAFLPDAIWPGRAGMNRQDDRVSRSEDPELWWEAVYRDAPITTQWDDGDYSGTGKGHTPSSSSSMPTMVFSMLNALDVRPGQRVLEIGTGTGWNAALLSHRLGDANVVTIETDETVARTAKGRLFAAYRKPTIIVGDGEKGYDRGAPYDRIIATCSLGHIPSQWLGQARPGTVIVAPWGPTYGGEAVARLTVVEDGVASGRFVGSSAFMRMRQQRRSLPDWRLFHDEQNWRRGGTESTTTLSPDDVGDWIHMFAIGVQVPDLFCRVERGQEGAYRLFLYDTDTTSWAAAEYERGRTEYRVLHAGPRNLWEELGRAWRWWDAQGQPGFDRFGLTTRGGPDRQVWLDTPDNPVPDMREGHQ